MSAAVYKESSSTMSIQSAAGSGARRRRRQAKEEANETRGDERRRSRAKLDANRALREQYSVRDVGLAVCDFMLTPHVAYMEWKPCLNKSIPRLSRRCCTTDTCVAHLTCMLRAVIGIDAAHHRSHSVKAYSDEHFQYMAVLQRRDGPNRNASHAARVKTLQKMVVMQGLPLEQHDPGIGGRRGSSSGDLTVASGSATVGASSNSNANNSSSSSNLVLTAALQEEEKCSLRGLVWKVCDTNTLTYIITLYCSSRSGAVYQAVIAAVASSRSLRKRCSPCLQYVLLGAYHIDAMLYVRLVEQEKLSRLNNAFVRLNFPEHDPSTVASLQQQQQSAAAAALLKEQQQQHQLQSTGTTTTAASSSAGMSTSVSSSSITTNTPTPPHSPTPVAPTTP
eukprot:16326-Heterococcus_DN1.PRE.1